MGKFYLGTRVGEALKDWRVVALVEEYAPGILKHPALPIVKLFTLETAFSYKGAAQRSLNISYESVERFISSVMKLE